MRDDASFGSIINYEPFKRVQCNVKQWLPPRFKPPVCFWFGPFAFNRDGQARSVQLSIHFKRLWSLSQFGRSINFMSTHTLNKLSDLPLTATATGKTTVGAHHLEVGSH